MINIRAIVTGGAGFIGSHMVDALLKEGYEVTVLDNLSTGKKENILHNFTNSKFTFKKIDLLESKKLITVCRTHDIIFHFAANADIRFGLQDTKRDLEQNTIATYNVLEAARKNDIKKILFSSSSAIYGEPKTFPTPESYAPIPTSLYGASKLASEALIEAYCEGFGLQSWVFRFVSVLGERYPHGVVIDFVNKLKKNPKKLEILGDGNQKKSFLYVKDCIDGILFALKHANDKVNIFNLGVNDYIIVKKMADIVVNEMNLKNVEYNFTGGIRGWIGDAPFVFLSIEKMEKLGWSPEVEIEESIRKTVRWLLQS